MTRRRLKGCMIERSFRREVVDRLELRWVDEEGNTTEEAFEATCGEGLDDAFNSKVETYLDLIQSGEWVET